MRVLFFCIILCFFVGCAFFNSKNSDETVISAHIFKNSTTTLYIQEYQNKAVINLQIESFELDKNGSVFTNDRMILGFKSEIAVLNKDGKESVFIKE